MKPSPALAGLPMPVRRALRKLGADISAARRRRRITMAQMAERSFVSRNTIVRVEAGDPGVSLGIYATVLFVLGMIARVGELADASSDRLGLSLEDEQLPRRIRSSRRTRTRDPDDGT